MGNPCAQERGLEEGLSRLGQCPAERLRTQHGKADYRQIRQLSGTPCLSGALWNPRAGQKESGLRVGHKVTSRSRCHQGCNAGCPGASARRREVGGGGTPEPGLTPGGRPTSEAAQGRATVTQRARGRQSGRRGAARPTSQRGGRRSCGGRGPTGAGRAGDSGRKPPVSISARSCGGGAGS